MSHHVPDDDEPIPQEPTVYSRSDFLLTAHLAAAKQADVLKSTRAFLQRDVNAWLWGILLRSKRPRRVAVTETMDPAERHGNKGVQVTVTATIFD